MTTKRKYDDKQYDKRSGGYDATGRNARAMTAKMLSFIHHYLSPETLYQRTKSAELAGYKHPSSAGQDCLEHPRISAEIARRLRRVYASADLTVTQVLASLEEVRRMAIRLEQPNAANRSIELQGKFLKMFVDRIEHTHSVEDAPTSELTALLNSLVASGNIEGLSFPDLMEQIGGTVDPGTSGDGPAASRTGDSEGAPPAD